LEICPAVSDAFFFRLLFHDHRHSPRETPVKLMSEFHGIILAGGGKSLFPFSSKARLPLCNSPLLANSVNWMQTAGISNISVVCNSSDKAWIADWANKWTLDAKNQAINVVVCNDSGSVAAIKSVEITSDFVVMPVDAYSQVPPHYLLDTHRLRLPSVTCLLHDAKLETSPIAIQRGANKDSGSVQFIGLDGNSDLLYLGFGEDVAESDDEMDAVPLRYSLLRSKPKFTSYTHLRDAHIYIFRRWVSDWIAAKPNLVSLQRDVIPLLIKAQYAGSRWRERQGIDTCTHLPAND